MRFSSSREVYRKYHWKHRSAALHRFCVSQLHLEHQQQPMEGLQAHTAFPQNPPKRHFEDSYGGSGWYRAPEKWGWPASSSATLVGLGSWMTHAPCWRWSDASGMWNATGSWEEPVKPATQTWLVTCTLHKTCAVQDKPTGLRHGWNQVTVVAPTAFITIYAVIRQVRSLKL